MNTYDIWLDLTARSDGKKVTFKQVMIAVRKFYIARETKHKNTKRRVDKLPSNLLTDMNEKNLDDVDVLASSQVIGTISRYIKETNKIMENVAKGVFP